MDAHPELDVGLGEAGAVAMPAYLTKTTGGCSRRRSAQTSPGWLLCLDPVVQTMKLRVAVLLDNVTLLEKDSGNDSDDGHGGGGSGDDPIEERERERGGR